MHGEPYNRYAVTRVWHVTNHWIGSEVLRTFRRASFGWRRTCISEHRPHASGNDDLCSPSRCCGISRYAHTLDPTRRDRGAYWLGESYLQRARYRDAAEQFLKMTTSFGTSPKGADGMFKLGVSLRGLGANDQACATFAEFGRKYPNARPALVKDVQREQQRAKCAS